MKLYELLKKLIILGGDKMALFKIKGSNVLKLSVKKVSFEKDIQKLFENNLNSILNINLLKSEHPTSFGGRIDTLGIDNNGSPVIIEYKKNQNDNIINQGLSYLRWLLDHKAEFKILCDNKNIEIDIDWESPRVICIAENYNKFDIDTADFLPIKIELYRYKIYGGNLLSFEPEKYQSIKTPIAGIIKKGKKSKEKKVKILKSYDINDHLKKANKNTKNLFEILREKIMTLDEAIMEEPKAKYIAYKLSTNFVDLIILKNYLYIMLNIRSGELNDPNGIAEDLTKPKKIGHWGNGDYRVKFEKKEDLDSIFGLIKQSYDINR